MTIIKKCTCEHEFQDETYGVNNRVHNISGDGKTACCTVCSPSFRRDKNTLTRPARKRKTI